MRAGELRHRITAKSRTESSGTMGGVTYTEATVATFWAAVEPIRGSEYLADQQIANALTVRIRARYSSETAAITSKHILYEGSTAYDIESVLNVDGRNHEIQFICKARL